MPNVLCRLFACAMLLLALPLWAVEPVRIGVLAYPPKPWQPLAQELKRQIPERDFEIEILDHDGLAKAVETRHLDFVLTNAGHYLLMQRRSGLSSPLATLINDDHGHRLSVFGGAIICRADNTDIKNLKDIRGRTVAYVDHGSQGGYQMQANELVLKGVDLTSGVRWLRIGLPHELIVDAVLSGKADVGFVRAGLLESMASSGKLDLASIRVLNQQDLPDYPWQISTHLYPEWAFAALPHADEYLARRVTATLLELDSDPALVRSMQISGFTVPADYQVMEDLLWKLNLPPFDSASRFSFVDVWEKYRWQFMTGLALLGLVLGLAMWLVIFNQRIQAAQQTLARSERHYRLLVEYMRDVVWVLDPVTLRFSYVSPSVQRLRGYSADEVMQEPMDAAFTPEFYATLKLDMQARLAQFLAGDGQGDVYVEELPQPCKDGSLVWTEMVTRFYRNDESGQVEMHGVTRDISERRNAEEELRTSEALFRKMTDTSPLAIYMSSGIEQTAEYINPTFVRLFGYTIDEVPSVAKWWPLAYPDEDYRRQISEEWQRKAVHAIETHGEMEPMEVVVTCKDGSRKNILWGFVSIGEQSWAFGLDLTERKQAEDALRESEQRFRSLFHKHSSIMLLIEPDSGRIVDANLAAADFYGYSMNELCGMKIDQINTLTEEEISIERKMAQEEKRNHFVFSHRLANGEIRIVEVHSTPINDRAGQVLFSIVFDITERRKAEDALQRSNADLERFAYSVSHDMRQPLRAVSGHLQLLQRSLQGKLDENDRMNMDFALEGARRMDSMIVSLLDYSRVGRKTESKQWLDSHATVDEALSFLSPLIVEVAAEVRLSGDWPQVFASRDEMTRLFQNLIGNAIKFRETGQVPQVEVESSVQDGSWRVSVQDHGVGIDPQQIDRLFQFFSRLQSRARFEGTGMGLALCRRIVEHHNGRIWVESEGEGKGSVFIFELPIKVMESGA